MQPLATLALRGPVRVIDGGNHFRAYQLSKNLRAQESDPTQTLKHVYISRSFTCHQLTVSLGDLKPQPFPLFVFDFLATFQDENISHHERYKLFTACLSRLRQISRDCPLLVTVKTNHKEFIKPLLANADQILQAEFESLPAQMSLF
jgi:hypothetical protein